LIGSFEEVLQQARAAALLHRCLEDGTRESPMRTRVLCFAGYAVWSKTQLLGEVARGSWRWRPGTISDVLPLPDRLDDGAWVPPEERFEHCFAQDVAPPLQAASPNDLSRDFERRMARRRPDVETREDAARGVAVAHLLQQFEISRHRS